MNLPQNGILQVTPAVIEKARRHFEPFLLKLNRMQEIYLKKNNALYTDAQICLIKKSFDAVQFKFSLSYIHLEQLWILSMDSRWRLVDVLANSLERLCWDDNQKIIGSLFLESFLFQARAFLDFYMFYICLMMGNENPGYMSFDKFKNHMAVIKNTPFKIKAKKLAEYFGKEVFGIGKWGKLLQSLRDKIAHLDWLRPSYNGSEVLLNSVLLDWPTLQKKTFERFCQDIHNDIFKMITDTAPILFDMEWKPGPFEQGI